MSELAASIAVTKRAESVDAEAVSAAESAMAELTPSVAAVKALMAEALARFRNVGNQTSHGDRNHCFSFFCPRKERVEMLLAWIDALPLKTNWNLKTIIVFVFFGFVSLLIVHFYYS